MTKTYTKGPADGMVKTLNKENTRLDFDDELFYDIIKSKMDTLLRQPQRGSINKITSYSKARRTTLM